MHAGRQDVVAAHGHSPSSDCSPDGIGSQCPALVAPMVFGLLLVLQSLPRRWSNAKACFYSCWRTSAICCMTDFLQFRGVLCTESLQRSQSSEPKPDTCHGVDDSFRVTVTACFKLTPLRSWDLQRSSCIDKFRCGDRTNLQDFTRFYKYATVTLHRDSLSHAGGKNACHGATIYIIYSSMLAPLLVREGPSTCRVPTFLPRLREAIG